MKKLLLFLLLPIFQIFSSQITFQNYVYSFGPNPYNAQITGNGTIYYTTNGTEPTVNSPSGVNEVNISISEVLTVKAILKNSNNQLSQVFSKKYYFGQFPIKAVYFKPPPTWTSACSFSNSEDPQIPLDVYSGDQMTAECEGWYKSPERYFVGRITFDNCVYPPFPPFYKSYNVITENTIFYDYSSGPITNPPACLLAVNDPSKKIAVVKVFPNPVQDFITIDSEQKFTSYEIVDATGKSVNKNELSENKINVAKLNPGIYFIKLNAVENSNTIIKFIKK